MLIIALLIGVVLIVAAIRGTQGLLFSSLSQDVPPYLVWAAAIIAVGALGYIPGLKPASRGLLALVIVVIVLGDYQQIISGFQSVIAQPAQASTTPATANSSAGTTSTQAGSLPSSMVSQFIEDTP